MGSIQVVLVDDSFNVRSALRHILEKEPDICIIGEASNGQEALKCVQEFSPDVLLLDMQMPVMDGVEVLERLHEEGAGVNILVFSAYTDPYYIQGVLEYGASGYITKHDALAVLIDSIRLAAAGNREIYSPQVSAVMKKKA